MTQIQAYKNACLKGHAKEFAMAFKEALRNRMSEVDSINFAINKVEEIPTKDEKAIAKMAYADAFNQAIKDGMSENQARMIALQSVPRRK
jgi:hypothetical protein